MNRELWQKLARLNEAERGWSIVDRANNEWPRLADSSRYIYEVSESLVLKVDWNGEQNYAESNPLIQKYALAAVPRVYLVGPWYRWLLSERVTVDRERVVATIVKSDLLDETISGLPSCYGADWDAAIRFLFSSEHRVAFWEARGSSQWGFRGDTPVLLDTGVRDYREDDTWRYYRV